MSTGDVGRESLRLLSPLLGTAVTIPVVAGYIALGAAILVGRSLLGVAGGGWRRLSSFARLQRREETSRRRAA
jgi:hypothetical protein